MKKIIDGITFVKKPGNFCKDCAANHKTSYLCKKLIKEKPNCHDNKIVWHLGKLDKDHICLRTDYENRETEHYITPGKLYLASLARKDDMYKFIDDEGDLITVNINKCAVLDGRPWEVLFN